MEEINRENKNGKKKTKVVVITLISVIFILAFVSSFIGYSGYKEKINEEIQKQVQQQLQTQYGEENVTSVEVNSSKPDPDIKNPLTTTNPRRSFLNSSGDEVAYIDHAGNIGGISNVIFNNTNKGYGFFKYVGSQAKRITKIWASDIDSSRINATNITTKKIKSADWTNITGLIDSQISDTITITEHDSKWSANISSYYTKTQTDSNLTNRYVPYTGANKNTNLGVYNVTAKWFKGRFNITSANNYLGFDGSVLTFNSSKLSTTFYNASSVAAITGTPQGTITGIRAYNGNDYNVSEASSDIDLRVNFTGITSFNQLIFRIKSASAESHVLSVQLWEYTTSSWQSYTPISNTNGNYVISTLTVYDSVDHLSGGIVQARFVTTNTGTLTHKWQFDWVAISSGPGTPSATETDPFSIHTNGMTPLTANWGQGAFNLTDTSSWFLGKVNYSSIKNSPSFYLKSNPFGFWNSTKATFNKTYADTLYSTKAEPLWSGNRTLLVPYTGATTNVNLGVHNLTVNTNTLFVNTNGRVGIGTTAPEALLHVAGAGTVRVGPTFIGTDSIAGIYFSGTPSSTADYSIHRTTGAWSAPDYQQLLLDWDTGIILNPGSGDYGKSHVGIVGGLSIGDSYYTTEYDNGLIVQGNVGIGTTSPTSLLTLSGDDGTNGLVSFVGTGNAIINSKQSFLFNIDSDSSQTDRVFTIYKDRTGQTGGTHLFTVQEDGNVGIGTTSPKNKLNVVGATNSTTGFIVGAFTGITNTTGFWMCKDATCTTKCQVQINGGLITGCI